MNCMTDTIARIHRWTLQQCKRPGASPLHNHAAAAHAN
jgi:hypothetical protein